MFFYIIASHCGGKLVFVAIIGRCLLDNSERGRKAFEPANRKARRAGTKLQKMTTLN